MVSSFYAVLTIRRSQKNYHTFGNHDDAVPKGVARYSPTFINIHIFSEALLGPMFSIYV